MLSSLRKKGPPPPTHTLSENYPSWLIPGSILRNARLSQAHEKSTESLNRRRIVWMWLEITRPREGGVPAVTVEVKVLKLNLACFWLHWKRTKCRKTGNTMCGETTESRDRYIESICCLYTALLKYMVYLSVNDVFFLIVAISSYSVFDTNY